MCMDADLDPLLGSRLAEELARVPAPAARPPRVPRRATSIRIAAIVAVVLVAGAAAGRELVSLRTPASPTGSTRALYLGDPYGIGWLEIDPLTLASRGTRALLDLRLSPSEAAVISADGTTIVVSQYVGLLANHAVYDARTGALRNRFTDQEPMVVDAISADGTQVIGRAGSANHSMTDGKLIVSTTDGRIVRRVPAVEGCCDHAVLYDPSLASIYYVLGPSISPSAPGLAQLTLLAQSTTTGATKTVALPGIQAGRILSFGSPTVASVPTLFFAATVLSPDGAKVAALSLDGSTLDIVDTSTLQVAQKTLVRQTSWRDLFEPLVAYGKEPADNDSWNAAFSPDGRTLFAFHTQQNYSTAGSLPSSVQARTLALERIDIERGVITAAAPQTSPFTDFTSDLVPSSDGQSVYVLQGGVFGLADQTKGPVLRRLDARSLAIQAERQLDPSSWNLHEFQRPVTSPAAAAGLNIDSRGAPSIIVVVGDREIARIPCSGGDILRPGVGGAPPLPWDLRVLRQSDRSVLLATAVTALPKWLLLVGDSVALSDTPVAGPAGPMCSSP
jgi:hypothetical protein